jgi:DNA-binding GntR family transcriptional regulator
VELLSVPRGGSSAREYVYEALKKNIILLHLKPGQSITEQEIAEKFSVSRTPVREAFIRLAQEGLLETFPQRGTVVSLIDLERVDEARFMRRTLEKAVLRLACEAFPSELAFELRSNLALQEVCLEEKNFLRLFELDEEFHRLIYRGCKKERIWDLICQINADFRRIRVLKLSSGIRVGEVVEQHRKIAGIIFDRDPGRVEAILDEHLPQNDPDFERLREEYPEYFRQRG